MFVPVGGSNPGPLGALGVEVAWITRPYRRSARPLFFVKGILDEASTFTVILGAVRALANQAHPLTTRATSPVEATPWQT